MLLLVTNYVDCREFTLVILINFNKILKPGKCYMIEDQHWKRTGIFCHKKIDDVEPVTRG